VRTDLIDAKLVAAELAQIPEVNLTNGEALANLIGMELRRDFHVVRSAILKMYLLNLVQKCLDIEDGIEALLSALDYLAPDSSHSAEVRRLLSPADGYLSSREEHRVKEWLRQCTVPNLAALYQVATANRSCVFPPRLNDPCDVFTYLLDATTPRGHAPPHLRFVAFLIRTLLYLDNPSPAGTVDRLREWVYQQRDQLHTSGDPEGAADLRRLVRHAPPFQLRTDFPVCLIVQLDQVPAPYDERDLHRVTHWLQFDHTRWCPERGGDVVLPFAEVADHVLDLIRRTDENWASAPGGPLVLEFALPLELIDLDVDQWARRPGHGLPPRPLGTDYEVVLRSHTDLRPRTHTHNSRWAARWALLVNGTRTHVIPEPDADVPGALQDQLLNSEESIVYILSSPPTQEPGHSEFMAAMEAGLPIVLWCRNTEASDAFREAMREVVKRQLLPDLPQHVMRLRRTAAADNYHGISLLWDDPNRVLHQPTPLGTSYPQ